MFISKTEDNELLIETGEVSFTIHVGNEKELCEQLMGAILEFCSLDTVIMLLSKNFEQMKNTLTEIKKFEEEGLLEINREVSQ